VFLKIPNNFCSSIKECLFHKNVNVQITYFDLYFSAVFEVALVQLVAGVALIGSLDRVALGLDLLDLCLPGDGTQFGQDRSGIDLTVGHQATLLQETVGKHFTLGSESPKLPARRAIACSLVIPSCSAQAWALCLSTAIWAGESSCSVTKRQKYNLYKEQGSFENVLPQQLQRTELPRRRER